MKRLFLISWVSFLLVAVVFSVAAFRVPETRGDMARHRADAAAWQQKQIDKGVGAPPAGHRAAWKDAPWARALETWDHTNFLRINHDWDNHVFDHAMPLATDLGDGKYTGGLLLCLLGWSYAMRRKDWQATALLSIAGAILGVIAPVIKLFIVRYRPPAVYPYRVVLLMHPLYGHSFPSGHTLLSFIVATVIARRHPWLTPWMYGLAVLIGISRISVGAHWPLDVLASAVLGTLIGCLVTALWTRRSGKVGMAARGHGDEAHAS